MLFHGVEKTREGKEQGLDSIHKEQSGGVESEWRDVVKFSMEEITKCLNVDGNDLV